jgi:hypothetical protein
VLAPALRDEYDRSLSDIGVLLAATSGGMVFTLLAWGLLTDRIGERAVAAAGLGAAGAAFVDVRRGRQASPASRRCRSWVPGRLARSRATESPGLSPQGTVP